MADVEAVSHLCGREGRPHRPDERIGHLAGRQHGVVSRRQLLRLGLTDRMVDKRLRSRRLHLLRRGVYAVGHADLSQRGEWMAAVLAVGPRAVLSHRSAAGLWELLDPIGLIEVTAPGGTKSDQGLRIHRSRQLEFKRRTWSHRIPVTSATQTVFDLATAGESARLVRRAYEGAVRRGLLRAKHLAEMRRCARGHRDLGIIDELLVEAAPPPRLRSGLEQDFLDFCRDRSLPLPRCNAVVAGIEVDALWEEAELVVELDSWGYHRSRSAFERDRARDAELMLVGYRVIRVTGDRLETRPAEVELQLRRLLGA